jgi:hypothetical protein
MVRAMFFKAVLANDTVGTTAAMLLPMTMGGRPGHSLFRQRPSAPSAVNISSANHRIPFTYPFLPPISIASSKNSRNESRLTL